MAGRGHKVGFGIVIISNQDFYRFRLNKTVFIIGYRAQYTRIIAIAQRPVPLA